MNRIVLSGVAVFCVLLGIALCGGENIAVAGHGCCGCSCSCSGCFGCGGCYGCSCSGCFGCGGCYGCSCSGCFGCYGCSCSGCYGCSCSGCYGCSCSGCYGCYGGCGGCGGITYAPPIVHTPHVEYAAPIDHGTPVEGVPPVPPAGDHVVPSSSDMNAASNDASSRLWTDDTGRHQVDASYISFVGGNVKLQRKSSGATMTVPFGRLSEVDQAHVLRLARN